ncbi:MAG: hypothetical protein V3U75_00500 [Methylococcaceae bacterium]
MYFQKLHLLLLVSALFVVIPQLSLAYGSGSATSSCPKPTFTNMTPPAKSVVTPGSEFSFTASKSTQIKTLQVTAKGEKVPVTSKPKKNGTFIVTGKLPSSITDGFARVSISAKSSATCQGTDGWLLQIGG